MMYPLNLLFSLESLSLHTANCDAGAHLDIKVSVFGVVGFNLLLLMSKYLILCSILHKKLPLIFQTNALATYKVTFFDLKLSLL